MKILYHHRTLGDGAEGIHIAEMVNAFRQLGHEVLVLGPGVTSGQGKEKPSHRYKWVKQLLRGPLYECAEVAYNMAGYLSIAKAIQIFRPDFLYDRYITFNYSAVAVSRKYDLPIFLEVNAPLAYERFHEEDETLYLKSIAFAIEKKVCSNATKTIVVSTPLKEYLMDIGVPEDKILILPNGVNTEKFFPQKKPSILLDELEISSRDIVIGFVGILRPWHGIDLLLDAYRNVLKSIPNSKLLLVGDGPIRSEIEGKAKSLNIDKNIVITGRISHERIPNYVALFDIAVSPRATFYASPMKIVEYMAQKKAVVAPNSPNIRDIIEHGVTGYCFREGDATSMSQAILKLLYSKQLMQSIGANALKRVQDRLNWIQNAREIISLITK